MELLNSESLADTWEGERVGWLASSMPHSGEVMSLLATMSTQLELPVSKNALLYLHWVAKGLPGLSVILRGPERVGRSAQVT